MSKEVNLEKVVSELVYRSCMFLDERKFEDYLSLCSDDFTYTITAYSPEISKDMLWMDEDKASLKRMLDVLPRHNSDHTPLTRHATVYTIDYDETKKVASVISGLLIFKTNLDGGETKLFAVAKYYDSISLDDEEAKLLNRNVKLDTRELGLGSHIHF